MQNNNTRSKLLSYFLILFSLCVLLLFTKDLFFEVQALRDKKWTVQQEITKKEKELTVLKQLKKSTIEGVEQYTKEFQEDSIIDYIYGEVEKANTSNGRGIVAVNSLSIWEGAKNDLGFMESAIDLEIQVGSQEKMIALLDALVSEEAPYKFFIDTFSYELPESKSRIRTEVGAPTQSFSVSIPLRCFYK